MGYNSWYDLECSESMNESTLRQIADAMVDTGLRDLGYNYLNLDDCWAKGRHANGTVFADPAKFPSSTLKPLADYVHSKGLRFGTYTDRGTATCAGRPGASNYEKIDAETYAEWGVDYLKEDSCNAPSDHDTAFQQYGRMRDALNATGRPILFSLCGWSAWYAPVGKSLGNSWRIGPDDTDWSGVLKNIDAMSGLDKFAGPGGWNDPCLLLSRQWTGTSRVSELQTRAQFSMWSVLAAPLLISGSILNMSTDTLTTYSNREVIAVSQDTLGIPGRRLYGSSMADGRSTTNIWGRQLSNGAASLVFLNVGPQPETLTCDHACFASMGFAATDHLKVRDLWSKQQLPDVTASTLTANLPPNGGHLMVSVQKESAQENQLLV
ncbi:melA [Symbiodinium pilosum]|uniref:Alpha-galactosidase n=1 Tax=Symbiodinium pilosum TaxID=2952 RepID=A0A812SGZ7_SYMPI|nr:melA [Symbiodinium pilosum]